MPLDVLDPLENFLLRLFAEALQEGEPVLAARVLQFADCADSEFFPEHLHLAGAESRYFQHLHEARRVGSPQFLVILALPGGNYFGNLFLQRPADALYFPEPARGGQFGQVGLEAADGAGGVQVGAALVGILSFDLKQSGDLFQDFCYLLLSGKRLGSANHEDSRGNPSSGLRSFNYALKDDSTRASCVRLARPMLPGGPGRPDGGVAVRAIATKIRNNGKPAWIDNKHESS